MKITDAEIEKMKEEYTQGLNLSEIGRLHKLDSKRVKRLLVKAGVDFENTICKRCKKHFKRTHVGEHFCNNPCVQSEERDINVKTWRIVTVMRSQIWELSKSNPRDVVKLNEEIKKTEGKEFAKLVFGDILKNRKFKLLLKTYNEYNIGEEKL